MTKNLIRIPVLFLKGLVLSFTVIGCESISSSSYSDPHAGMSLEEVYAKARRDAGYPPMRPDPPTPGGASVYGGGSETTSAPSTSARDARMDDKPPGGQSLPPLVWSEWRTSSEVPGIRFRYRREISSYDGGWRNRKTYIPTMVNDDGESAGYRWAIQVQNNTPEVLNIWKLLRVYRYSTYHNDGNFAAEKGPITDLWFPVIMGVKPGTTGECSFADLRYDL